jgi:SAM-dependent methyltransferase
MPSSARAIWAVATGERPTRDSTPDAVVALHDAGYREVIARLGEGVVLDLGCGLGFETARLAGEGRMVVGIDYSLAAAAYARAHTPRGCRFLVADCARLALRSASADFVCSSHLIEHFERPALHVAEVARVLKRDGTAFFITPNAPADFENPFHLVLFTEDDLRSLLMEHFYCVEVMGIEASERAKADVEQRRAKARRVYRLDVLGLRKRMPPGLWRALYGRLLPVAQRLVYRGAFGGSTGISEEDFHLTQSISETTPALFAVARRPKGVAGLA